MSKLGQITTTSFIDWNDFISLITRLEKDKEYKFCLLVSIGVFTGLRISDLLTLKYLDILGDNVFLITEKKTKNLIIEKIKKGNASRYTAINLTNKNTIEIRYNKGTLRLETFIASAQLIYNIYQLAIVRNKTIETLDFKDLINKGKHRELIAYWTRLNTRTKTDQNDRADNQNKNREME